MHHVPGLIIMINNNDNNNNLYLMHEIFKGNGAFILYYQLNPFYVINLGFTL